MFEIIMGLLCAVIYFFLISRVCIFFSKRDVDPFTDSTEESTEEARKLESERQQLMLQGMYQVREGINNRMK